MCITVYVVYTRVEKHPAPYGGYMLIIWTVYFTTFDIDNKYVNQYTELIQAVQWNMFSLLTENTPSIDMFE